MTQKKKSDFISAVKNAKQFLTPESDENTINFGLTNLLFAANLIEDIDDKESHDDIDYVFTTLLYFFKGSKLCR